MGCIYRLLNGKIYVNLVYYGERVWCIPVRLGNDRLVNVSAKWLHYTRNKDILYIHILALELRPQQNSKVTVIIREQRTKIGIRLPTNTWNRFIPSLAFNLIWEIHLESVNIFNILMSIGYDSSKLYDSCRAYKMSFSRPWQCVLWLTQIM